MIRGLLLRQLSLISCFASSFLSTEPHLPLDLRYSGRLCTVVAVDFTLASVAVSSRGPLIYAHFGHRRNEATLDNSPLVSSALKISSVINEVQRSAILAVSK